MVDTLIVLSGKQAGCLSPTKILIHKYKKRRKESGYDAIHDLYLHTVRYFVVR